MTNSPGLNIPKNEKFFELFFYNSSYAIDYRIHLSFFEKKVIIHNSTPPSIGYAKDIKGFEVRFTKSERGPISLPAFKFTFIMIDNSFFCAQTNHQL